MHRHDLRCWKHSNGSSQGSPTRWKTSFIASNVEKHVCPYGIEIKQSHKIKIKAINRMQISRYQTVNMHQLPPCKRQLLFDQHFNEITKQKQKRNIFRVECQRNVNMWFNSFCIFISERFQRKEARQHTNLLAYKLVKRSNTAKWRKTMRRQQSRRGHRSLNAWEMEKK